MESWQGALPTFYAATMPDVIPGALYGHDQHSGIRGYRALPKIQSHAFDEAMGLWLKLLTIILSMNKSWFFGLGMDAIYRILTPAILLEIADLMPLY